MCFLLEDCSGSSDSKGGGLFVVKDLLYEAKEWRFRIPVDCLQHVYFWSQSFQHAKIFSHFLCLSNKGSAC
jgi:hypothetical protein